MIRLKVAAAVAGRSPMTLCGKWVSKINVFDTWWHSSPAKIDWTDSRKEDVR
jgi:hypothetical protein